MKKSSSNDLIKKDQSKNRNNLAKQKIVSDIKHMNGEDTEDFRESVSLEAQDIQPPTTTNWSEAQDRSEDFVNETDPFIQKPEKAPKIPRDNRL